MGDRPGMTEFLARYDAEQKRKERSPEPTRFRPEWTRDEGNTSESRVTTILYPRDSYYVIDGLEPDGIWYQLEGKGQDTQERAEAQAQTLANRTQRPHRVREVLPD